ncbi:hypothetical protein CCUS01_15598 [Colletotrichum cuscutae]|uniref:Uncharacterized protein n=3 Tax=Colletotrichum acutatum species complex TaxID=2707335 RepID=A0AAJ0E8Y2_9PEZI|nr:uncharacterized protein CCOS01_01422 [Colletotrichum costaricense]XP_060382421.1 uncharacterized protein CTAM01_06893 [Colletotrichum tamarilloi]KAI3545342.1 hypothetical protein CSPX01_04986 [Colletotrichum filicis]KAK1483897.1 hypothetical protein CCUS01_15598 [Colletotrichum cuscutae]KAK1499699.1 hypothetical protein CTAM01_06893 [Colletotrichum tamarilloi]KAK1540108.1 hypothetical protein CCOS01_01422 [Colletotrichum costaricense]
MSSAMLTCISTLPTLVEITLLLSLECLRSSNFLEFSKIILNSRSTTTRILTTPFLRLRYHLLSCPSNGLMIIPIRSPKPYPSDP